jgi:hypothetical protein
MTVRNTVADQLYRALVMMPCRCCERPSPSTCGRCKALQRYERQWPRRRHATRRTHVA